MNKKIKLSIYTGLFSLFYLICLYENLAGAMFPLFVAGTVLYIALCMKAAGRTMKIDAYGAIVIASGFLLGISNIITDNTFVKIVNYFAIFFSILLFSSHVFSDDKEWGFLQNIGNLFIHEIGAFSHFGYIFKDLKSGLKKDETEGENKPKNHTGVKILITVIATLPILFVILAILSSADRVFAEIAEEIFENISFSDLIKIPVIFFLVACMSYGIIRRALTKKLAPERRESRDNDSVIAITVSIMFDIIYVLFSAIQIVYLFIGGGTLPEGYSYASYAREGFFQLLFVAFFNFVIIIIGNTIFKKNTLLKMTQLIMSVCTFIMIFSSMFRLTLYIRYYYFTFSRILAFWALITLMVFMIGAVIQIFSDSFNMYKYLILAFFISYLVLAFSRSEYHIARLNLGEVNGSNDFFISDSYEDFYYLKELSSDALPVLLESESFKNSFEDSYYETYDRYIDRVKEDMDERKLGIRNFNYSVYKAKKALQNVLIEQQ